MKRIFPVVLWLVVSTCAQAQAEELGKVTYQMACSNCHAPSLAKGMGAPAAFDKKAWKARFKTAKIEAKNNPQRYNTPLDYLLTSVINGKNLMHHGGLCHESTVHSKNCTKKAYVEAIRYMSGQ